MKVLVTGATGYVGLNLVYRLQDTEHEPIALVRESSRSELLPESVPTFVGDITAPSTLDKPIGACDAIAHLAATIAGYDYSAEGMKGESWELSQAVNVDGTDAVLQKAADHSIESIVYTSTTRAHPAVSDHDDEVPYVRSKREADSLFLDHEHSFGYTVVHPTYVIGKRDYRMKRFDSFNMVRSNLLLVPPLYIPGKMNILPMSNLVESLVHFLEQPKNDRVLLSGENIHIKEYMKEIASVTSGRTIVLPFPGHEYVVPPLVDLGHRLNLLPVTGDRLRGSLSRSIGIVPDQFENQVPVERTSWRQAIRETYEWYESVGLL